MHAGRNILFTANDKNNSSFGKSSTTLGHKKVKRIETGN